MILGRLFTAILGLVSLSTAVQAAESGADSLSIFRRTMLDASPAGTLPEAVLRNPVAMGYRQAFSLSELSIGYERDRRREAALAQEGDGYDGFGFAARSFVRTGPKGRVFGEAGYDNGTRRNVRWNETADFDLLGPYVTADSVGGDLKVERYRFSGGYAHTTDRWSWAARLDYRAQLEYREVDPRPRNVVSDLTGSLAAARSVGAGYRLSIAARGRKYGQRGDIAFYNDMHQATVYHMTGLGRDYVRFAGIQTSAYYAGWGVGGSIDLFPAAREGFSASVAYDYFTFRKEMSGMNNLPLVTMADGTLQASLAYRGSGSAVAWGAEARGGYRRRVGQEHLFGDPTGNIYPEIGTATGYADRTAYGTVSGFVGSRPTARTIWWVEPSLSYLDFRADCRSVARLMTFGRWRTGVQGTVMRGWKRWLIGVGGEIALSGGLNSDLSLPGADFGMSRIRTLQENYRYLTDDFTRLRIEARANYRLGGDRTVFVRCGWRRDWFRASGSTDRWSVAVGFAL